jgi:hypothetical protein
MLILNILDLLLLKKVAKFLSSFSYLSLTCSKVITLKLSLDLKEIFHNSPIVFRKTMMKQITFFRNSTAISKTVKMLYYNDTPSA